MTMLSQRRDFDPVSRLLDLQRELDKVFQSPSGLDLGLSGRGVHPPLNIFRDEAGVTIRVEVPGFANEQLSVQSHGQSLIIEGKPDSAEPAAGGYHRRERPLRAFSRSLQLPRDVDPARSAAECRNGILAIHVPLREEVKPKEIRIQGL